MLIDPGLHTSWLPTPPGVSWPRHAADETNTFVIYRRLLWSWHRATDSGWTDDDFVETIRSIDAAVATVDGSGFTRTPAAWVPSLSRSDTAARVFVKDETGNVSGSHKARHLMGLLLHLAVDAVDTDTRLAISSCGNAALGAATVARAAGRPIDVFIPTWADAAVVATLSDLDATIHVCERRQGEIGDPCMLRFQEAVGEGSLAFGVQATENRWTLDGGRTIGWEMADQVAGDEPEHLFIQVGGGALLTSAAMGLLEASALGSVAAVPRVWAVQAEGCAPFDRAWSGISAKGTVGERHHDAESRGSELMVPWTAPVSEATGILDDVTYDWLGVARALLLTHGGSVVATEAEIAESNALAVACGFDADHTGSAGLAGLMSANRMDIIDPDESAAVLMTGVRR